MEFFITLLLAYIIGSIPTAYLVTKKFLQVDIRKYGSGNVGATNAARKLGFKMGALVAVVDIIKGLIPILIARTLLPADFPAFYFYIIAISAIFGHVKSIFLKFDGGKGVATTFGVMLGVAPASFAIMGLAWLLIAFSLKIVSVASLIASFTLPITAFVFTGSLTQTIFAAIIFLIIVVTHRGNIKRLKQGEETPINLGNN